MSDMKKVSMVKAFGGVSGCPWCDSFPSLYVETDENGNELRAQVRCKCGARGTLVESSTPVQYERLRKKAVSLWNSRRAGITPYREDGNPWFG